MPTAFRSSSVLRKSWLHGMAVSLLAWMFPYCGFAEEAPRAVKAILAGVESLGMDRFPIGFWNYTKLAEHGIHMNEAAIEEWADAGFTVPQGSSFDPSDPKQVAHMRQILDWCEARHMKLMLVDPRCQAGWGEKDGKFVAKLSR